MKVGELRPLTEEQLTEQLRELHEEWRDLRFQEAVGQLTATARTREIRKTIARIHTIRTERETDEATRAYLLKRDLSSTQTVTGGKR
jgi:large subunit ribosomal protein L29